MKILVKERNELNEIIESYIEKHKKDLTPEGICSEKSIRETESSRYDLIAGKELDVEKVEYDGNLIIDGYNYDYRWHSNEKLKDGTPCVYPIYPDEIVKEI